MDKELEAWKTENIKQTQLVEEEERLTEQSLQPFYSKMNELDIQIKEQLAKINATKAKLSENDISIHQMLCIHKIIFLKLYFYFILFFSK
jgi:Microtubule-binding protein MIP-T3 C-terminal region